MTSSCCDAFRPAGYSVDAADWVTESTAAFSRPFTPVRRRGLSPNYHAIAVEAPTPNPPDVSAPLDSAVDTRGLFTQVLFPRRRRARRVSAVSLPPDGVPVSRGAADFVPSPRASLSQQRRPSERFYHGHCRRYSEDRFPARRRISSAGALAEAIRGHQYERRNPLTSRSFRTREDWPGVEETGQRSDMVLLPPRSGV